MGFRIAKILLEMGNILEAKDLFMKLLNRKEESEEMEALQRLEILINLAHISLILNENVSAERFLREACDMRSDFSQDFEISVIKLVFFLVVRRLPQRKRRLLWIMARSFIDFNVGKNKKIEFSLDFVKDCSKKYWNLIDFMEFFFDELIFVCEKNEYINDSEYWRLYLKNISIKDPHNMQRSIDCLLDIINLIGNEVFLEELTK